MAEILREGTNFGKIITNKRKLRQGGQTSTRTTNFSTKYLVIVGTNFDKNQIKNGKDIARRDKIQQK
jgi:hypothetical protein